MDKLFEENVMIKLKEIDELTDAVSAMLRDWNCRGSRALDNICVQLEDIIKELEDDLNGEQQEEKEG